MVGPAEDLLRRLTVNEESAVRTVLALRPVPNREAGVFDDALAPRTRTLVRLAALVGVGASTTSLHWAVELATGAGADDEEIVRVLVTVGADVGLARVVSTAPRLAMAMGYDIEVAG